MKHKTIGYRIYHGIIAALALIAVLSDPISSVWELLLHMALWAVFFWKLEEALT